MKVLIADKLSSSAITSLDQLGCEVTVDADLKAEQLAEAIGDAEVLVVRSTKVTAAAIESARSLALIIRAGAGVNTIDLQSASAQGVYVCNCPGQNTAAVAELAIGLMIAADRRIADATVALRSGHWQKKKFGKARGLKGRTLGILGLGAIGIAVTKIAKSMEMNVVAWSRSLTEERANALGVTKVDAPIELAKVADIVSIHLALSEQTKHLVDEAFLKQLQPGTLVVNTSRGDLVDTRAMEQAIGAGRISYATDVFENEPAGGEAPFEQAGFVASATATPHIGASTDQASEAIAFEVVRIIQQYQAGGPPPGAVNLCDKSPANFSLTVRHFNRVGVLAKILDGLRSENVNVEEMENVIFDDALAACATLKLDDSPSPELLEKIEQDEAVLAVSLVTASSAS